MRLALAPTEATFLAGYLGRLRSWDEWAAVRLQVRGRVVGVYAALPMGVLSLVVLPLAAPPADADTADLDVTVLAGRFRDILGDVSAAAPGTRQVQVPDEVSGPVALTRLPPRDGWSQIQSGVADDLAAPVAAAVAAFREQVPAGGSLMADLVAAQAWDGPGWGGVPLAGLHAASLLGFLAQPQAPVRTAEAPGWSRLVTPAGQVFVHVSESTPDTPAGDQPPGHH